MDGCGNCNKKTQHEFFCELVLPVPRVLRRSHIFAWGSRDRKFAITMNGTVPIWDFLTFRVIITFPHMADVRDERPTGDYYGRRIGPTS